MRRPRGRRRGAHRKRRAQPILRLPAEADCAYQHTDTPNSLPVDVPIELAGATRPAPVAAHPADAEIKTALRL
ncbi:hypothetical protein [Candidatus Spongiihabitans sp.]|uniref:hypothetical protein n=1 Tax=Candidatus Spongiihabitans sp. TaxID=3101308 RepID=UPI003C6EBEF0